jgi:excisionase family DNA binding protein
MHSGDCPKETVFDRNSQRQLSFGLRIRGHIPAIPRPVRKVMPMADATDTIMTLDDLAAYVKLSKSSLYKLCQAGKVPGTKIGRTWRFQKSAIDEWMRSGAAPKRTGKKQASKGKKA